MLSSLIQFLSSLKGTWKLFMSWSWPLNMPVRWMHLCVTFDAAFNFPLYLVTVSTHMHSDHDTAAELLKKRLPNCQTVISAATGAKADILVRHGDGLGFGRHKLEVRATPGHTNGIRVFYCPLLLSHEALIPLVPNRLCNVCLPRAGCCLYGRHSSHSWLWSHRL